MFATSLAPRLHGADLLARLMAVATTTPTSAPPTVQSSVVRMCDLRLIKEWYDNAAPKSRCRTRQGGTRWYEQGWTLIIRSARIVAKQELEGSVQRLRATPPFETTF